LTLVVLDPWIRAEWLGPAWRNPLDGLKDPKGRWAAAVQGYLARVTNGDEPTPEAIVLPLRLPEVLALDDAWAGAAYPAALRLAREARLGGLRVPMVLTDRRDDPAPYTPLTDHVGGPVTFRQEPWDHREVEVWVRDCPAPGHPVDGRIPLGPDGPSFTSADVAAEMIPYLHGLAHRLDLVASSASTVERARRVTARLLDEAQDLPGHEIVVRPALEALAGFPWGADEQVWLDRLEYCASRELYLWASNPETRGEACRLLTHDLPSLVGALPVLLRLGRRLPLWGPAPVSGTDGSLIARFAASAAGHAEAVVSGQMTLADALKALREVASRELQTALTRATRPRVIRQEDATGCRWVLAVFHREDEWHREVATVVAETPWLRHNPAVFHAYSRSEAEAILRQQLPLPRTRGARPGLVLVGEALPDGSGLDFLEGLWDKVTAGDAGGDWALANYAYLTGSADAVRRAAESRYSDLLRVVLKTATPDVTRKRLQRLLLAPPGSTEPIPTVEIVERTRQPLRVLDRGPGGPRRQARWSLTPGRELAVVSVLGYPVFLTVWGFEVVRALREAGGRASLRGVAERVYDRYREWVEDIQGDPAALLANDEFVDWFAVPGPDSPILEQVRQVNAMAVRSLVETAVGPLHTREPRETFAQPQLVMVGEAAGEPAFLTLLGRTDRAGQPATTRRRSEDRLVVVVEDEEYWQREIAQVVRRAARVEPLVFASAEACRHWRQASVAEPDLYILDVSLETPTAGLDLLEDLVSMPKCPPVIIATGQTSPTVQTLLPHARAPKEYRLPPGLSAGEVLRRTRPPETLKWSGDFAARLEHSVKHQLALVTTGNDDLARIDLIDDPASGEWVVSVTLADGNVERLGRVNRLGRALIEIMAGHYPGLWLPQHLLTREMFEKVLQASVPSDWDFGQTFRVNAGIRGRLARLGLFEDAGDGSCLYRLGARLGSEG
jgi:hypothetical protein